MSKIGEERVLLLTADSSRRRGGMPQSGSSSRRARDCRCWPTISSGIGQHRTRTCHAVQAVTIPEAALHDEPMGGSITIADSASSAVACEEGEAACRMWCGMHRVARTRCRFAASAVLLLHGLPFSPSQCSPSPSPSPSLAPDCHPRKRYCPQARAKPSLSLAWRECQSTVTPRVLE
jgi:hypothetical protein